LARARAERTVAATVTPAPKDSEIRGRGRLGSGSVGEKFTDADNIADVVGAMLTDDGHADTPIDAAGRRNSSFGEAVEHLAEAMGRRISYVSVTAERCAALLADHDVPDELVVRLTRVLATLLDGDNARRTPGGDRPPSDFAGCARPESSAQLSHEHPSRSQSLSG
jgi:hypothetical protein